MLVLKTTSLHSWTLDGNNRAGEAIEEKVAAKLAKNPIKRLKVAGGATAPAGDDQAKAIAGKGW